MKKKYVNGTFFAILSTIILWVLFFIGEMLDVAKFGYSHWYDIPFVLTGLCVLGLSLAGTIYWITKED